MWRTIRRYCVWKAVVKKKHTEGKCRVREGARASRYYRSRHNFGFWGEWSRKSCEHYIIDEQEWKHGDQLGGQCIINIKDDDGRRQWKWGKCVYMTKLAGRKAAENEGKGRIKNKCWISSLYTQMNRDDYLLGTREGVGDGWQSSSDLEELSIGGYVK